MPLTEVMILALRSVGFRQINAHNPLDGSNLYGWGFNSPCGCSSNQTQMTNVEMFIEYINGDYSAPKLALKYGLRIQEVEVMISYGREEYYNTEYYKRYLKGI